MDDLDWIGCILIANGISLLLTLVICYCRGYFEYNLKFKFVKRLVEFNKQKQDVYLHSRWYELY